MINQEKTNLSLSERLAAASQYICEGGVKDHEYIKKVLNQMLKMPSVDFLSNGTDKMELLEMLFDCHDNPAKMARESKLEDMLSEMNVGTYFYVYFFLNYLYKNSNPLIKKFMAVNHKAYMETIEESITKQLNAEEFRKSCHPENADPTLTIRDVCQEVRKLMLTKWIPGMDDITEFEQNVLAGYNRCTNELYLPFYLYMNDYK